MTAEARILAADVCPGRLKLISYNLGALPEGEILRLAAHLEHCTSCLSALHDLDDRTDPLMMSLANIHDGTSTTGVPDEARILQRLLGIGGSVRAERKPPPRQVGPYEILKPLAEGGMGAVYTARHIHLGRIVALKLLPADRVADESSIARFMQEMKAAGQLSHPNIVQTFDAGVETVPFLAMELLEGMDLSRLVKERGPLTVGQSCECVRQAALALQHASTCGLVHRDIKPANLLLTPEGCVKVLDLGLARFGADVPPGPDAPSRDDAITSVGAVLGTIDYIAPEQLEDSRSVDSRADLYSLGCTLYFLLTGVPPFGGSSEGNLAKRQAHLNEPSPNIRVVRPNVPEGVAVILERLLAKNPDYRFVAPAELAASLQPFAVGCTLRGLTDASVLERGDYPSVSTSPMGKTPSSPQAHVFTWTMFALAFVLGIFLAVAFLMTRPAHDNKEIPGALEKKALAVESFEMEHFRTEGKEVRPLGTIGGKGAMSRDAFRITARAAEPAYFYLVAYLPDGKAVLCTPEQEAMKPTRTFVFPSEGLTALNDAGTHAFVLLAARMPLPPYERWQTGPAAWTKGDSAVAGAWKFDGQQISSLTPGLNAAPPGFKEVCNLFTARPGVDAVQAIALTVRTDEPPMIESAPKK